MLGHGKCPKIERAYFIKNWSYFMFFEKENVIF